MVFGLRSTSFSQLEVRVSRAMGLLGALLPGPGGIPCSGGWLGQWLPTFAPKVVDRYCLTCCLWACWMWYLVGFSRWVCTYLRVGKKDECWMNRWTNPVFKGLVLEMRYRNTVIQRQSFIISRLLIIFDASSIIVWWYRLVLVNVFF